MTGKTCLVTGANSGLGKEMAIELARRGAAVIMGCRRNYCDAREEIQTLSGNRQVSLRSVDLASLESVMRFCDALRDDGVRLDLVHLNAGMAAGTNERTVDGFSELWQVNYLSNALILMRFLKDGVIPNSFFCEHADRVERIGIPRILLTSSSRHRGPLSIDFDPFGVLPEFSLKDTFKYYGLSKLYLMTFAWALGNKLIVDGTPKLSIFAFCPGSFRSRIGEDLGFLGNLVMSTRPTSPQEAAWPGVYLACSPEVEGKTLIYYHKHLQETPDEKVMDAKNMDRTWEQTESLLIKHLNS